MMVDRGQVQNLNRSKQMCHEVIQFSAVHGCEINKMTLFTSVALMLSLFRQMWIPANHDLVTNPENSSFRTECLCITKVHSHSWSAFQGFGGSSLVVCMKNAPTLISWGRNWNPFVPSCCKSTLNCVWACMTRGGHIDWPKGWRTLIWSMLIGCASGRSMQHGMIWPSLKNWTDHIWH